MVTVSGQYLIVTRNLLASAEAGDLHAISSLLDSRERLLEQIKGLNLSDSQRQEFAEACQLDAKFQSILADQAREVKQLLCGAFEEQRGVTHYRASETGSEEGPGIAC